MAYLWVFVGGGLGSVCRYLISQKLYTDKLPWHTLGANVLAAGVLGIVSALLASKIIPDGNIRLLVITGFCGGLSTFSTFSFETLQLMKTGRWVDALIYVTLSVILSVAAVWLASGQLNSQAVR